MISRTPAGGVLLNRRYRTVVVAVIVGVFLAMVVPVTVDASTPARIGGPCSAPDSTPPRRFATPGWLSGGWATRS
jgi:hypothetical protein